MNVQFFELKVVPVCGTNLSKVQVPQFKAKWSEKAQHDSVFSHVQYESIVSTLHLLNPGEALIFFLIFRAESCLSSPQLLLL